MAHLFFKSLTMVGILYFSTQSIFARPVSRAEIEEAYRRASLGAELKYVDGLLANRSDDYFVIGPEGSRQDLSLERQRFGMLFADACRVKFETKVVRFETKGDTSDVMVTQLLRVEIADQKTDKLYTRYLTTQAIDRWKFIDDRPRMIGTRVVVQYFSSGPPIENDPVWPLNKPPVSTKSTENNIPGNTPSARQEKPDKKASASP